MDALLATADLSGCFRLTIWLTLTVGRKSQAITLCSFVELLALIAVLLWKMYVVVKQDPFYTGVCCQTMIVRLVLLRVMTDLCLSPRTFCCWPKSLCRPQLSTSRAMTCDGSGFIKEDVVLYRLSRPGSKFGI